MLSPTKLFAIPLLVLLLGAASSAGAETLYIEAGLVLPVSGDAIPNGRIIVRNGKVSEVGAALERPRFSKLIDAKDQTVCPGFVVPASRLGLPNAAPPRRRPNQDVSVSSSASLVAEAEFYPLHDAYEFLLLQGITSLGLLPPSSSVGLRGQLSAITTGKELSGRILKKEAVVYLAGSSHGPWRETVGAAFDKALKKVDEKEDSKKGKRSKKKGKKDSKKSKDPLVRLIKKEQPLLLVPRDPAGWSTAEDTLPLDRMKVSFIDQGRLWEIAERIAEVDDIRVVLYPTLSNRYRSRLPINRAAEYEAVGIPYAFRLPSDNGWGAAQLRDAAIEMARTGCDPEKVLRALTVEPAEVLGIADQVGTIEEGRRADLLFFSGHPLEPLSRLERVMHGGEFTEGKSLAGGDGA